MKSILTKASIQLILFFTVCFPLLAQDSERINLDEYGFQFSIELPEEAEVSDNQMGLQTSTRNILGEHILTVKIRKGFGLNDLYIKLTKLSFEELKEAKTQPYLAKYLTKVYQESGHEVIYEYKRGKKYYQLCGIIELEGEKYMYTSNDDYTYYTLKQIKLLSKIANSIRL
ncbi:MAG: hypothetical protein ACPGJS_16120 [Flammeovirgaceae bacterium]